MKRLLLALCLLAGLPGLSHAAYESLGRQESTASADGHVLVPIGCVRQNTIGSTTLNDADYGNVKCNSEGRVYTSTTIDAALPAGTNAIGKLSANTGVIIGDVNVVGSLPAGSAALGSVTTTSQVPGTGATNLGKAEGGVHADAHTGIFPLGVRHDTSTTGLGADGTYAALGLNSLGEIYTQANTELPAAALLTNNMPVPTVPMVGAVMLCYDGTLVDLCLPGLSDTDDNSVAFSQVTSIVIGQTHVSDGTSWVRQRTYLEDVASAGGEQLFLTGVVRQDTPAGSTSLDGDYTYLKSDSLGRLWINCATGCSGGTQYTEDVASAGAEIMSMAGTIRQDAPVSTTSLDGDYQNLKTDSIGRLWVNCGTGCSGGTQYAEDTVLADASTGTLALAKRTDAAASSAGTDGDVAYLNVDSLGRLWISGAAVEDAAETAGGTLMMTGNVRRDTPASSAGTSGDNSTFNTSSLGALYTQPIAGPAGGATPCYITSAASTNSTNCKASAGNLYTVSAVNTTGTPYYLRLYNLAAAPTCSSATGFIETIPVPASATGAGVVRDVSVGEAFGTGIGFCLTGGGSSTDATNAATGVYLTLLYN